MQPNARTPRRIKPSFFLGCALAASLLGLFVPAVPASAQEVVGGVFAMTNAAGENEIALYRRFDDGTLDDPRYFSTGGRGSGGQLTTAIDPLGSQGSLILSSDADWLFAANARSDEVSVFRVRPNRLELTDVERLRGDFPVSLALAGDRLYTLAAAGSGRIETFIFDGEGQLDRLPRGVRPLGLANGNPPRLADAPSQIAVSPDGGHLILSIKTDELWVYALDEEGRPVDEPVVNPSVGPLPFGFTFDRWDHVLVSQVFGGANGLGSVSSYELTAEGDLLPIDDSVSTFQGATCWAVSDGRFVFTTNTSSGTVSALRSRRNGRLRLRGRSGYPAGVGGSQSFPIDAALTPEGDFLYVLNAGTGTVAAHAIDRRGRLELIDEAGGLPAFDGAQGLAAY